MDAARRLIYATTAVVAVVWIVLDQATKAAAERTFTDGPPIDLGPLVLRLIYNEGGAFSLPIQLPWLFVGVTVIVCALVARALPDTDSIALAGAYGLVVGGAVGNAADRIFRDGAVVDMLDLDFPPLESFPVFNVADIGITVGASIVAVLLTLAERRDAAAAADAARPVLDDDHATDGPATDGPATDGSATDEATADDPAGASAQQTTAVSPGTSAGEASDPAPADHP